MSDNRHSLRKHATQTIDVTDSISGRVIGHVGNLSIDGMLLISPRALPPNALFQLSFNLPSPRGRDVQKIEVGVHEQWGETATVPGQFWTGFRIIDISPDDQMRLTGWVNASRD